MNSNTKAFLERLHNDDNSDYDIYGNFDTETWMGAAHYLLLAVLVFIPSIFILFGLVLSYVLIQLHNFIYNLIFGINK